MKVVILNDTSIRSKHFGCNLVMSAMEKLLADRGVEIIHRYHRKDIILPARLDRADLVILNGEGSLHHGKYEHLLDVAEKWPTVLVNASMQELTLPKNYGGSPFQNFELITVRETMTADYIHAFHNVYPAVVPDLIFSHAKDFALLGQAVKEPQGLLLMDSSGPRPAQFDTYVTNRNCLDKLARAERIVTGRFHGICAAAMMGRPFSAYPANTWKNEALMRDMGVDLHYHADYGSAVAHAPYVPAASVRQYVEDAVATINTEWDTICEL